MKNDLGSLLEILTDNDIEFILVGGLAAIIQGAPTTTIDVDIVHNQSQENLEKLIALLEQLDAKQRRPGDTVIKPTIENLAGKGHLLLETKLGPLDILAVIEQGKNFNDLVNHSVEIEFRGKSIKVLSLETMIRLKENSPGDSDLHKLEMLKKVLETKSK